MDILEIADILQCEALIHESTQWHIDFSKIIAWISEKMALEVELNAIKARNEMLETWFSAINSEKIKDIAKREDIND